MYLVVGHETDDIFYSTTTNTTDRIPAVPIHSASLFYTDDNNDDDDVDAVADAKTEVAMAMFPAVPVVCWCVTTDFGDDCDVVTDTGGSDARRMRTG